MRSTHWYSATGEPPNECYLAGITRRVMSVLCGSAKDRDFRVEAAGAGCVLESAQVLPTRRSTTRLPGVTLVNANRIAVGVEDKSHVCTDN
jgi:hypothetical protein